MYYISVIFMCEHCNDPHVDLETIHNSYQLFNIPTSNAGWAASLFYDHESAGKQGTIWIPVPAEYFTLYTLFHDHYGFQTPVSDIKQWLYGIWTGYNVEDAVGATINGVAQVHEAFVH